MAKRLLDIKDLQVAYEEIEAEKAFVSDTIIAKVIGIVILKSNTPIRDMYI